MNALTDKDIERMPEHSLRTLYDDLTEEAVQRLHALNALQTYRARVSREINTRMKRPA